MKPKKIKFLYSLLLGLILYLCYPVNTVLASSMSPDPNATVAGPSSAVNVSVSTQSSAGQQATEINPTIGLNQLSYLGGTPTGNFPLPAMFTTLNPSSGKGAVDYISNEANVGNFKQLLKDLKYDETKVDETLDDFLSKLKEVVEFVNKFFQGEKLFKIDQYVTESRVQRGRRYTVDLIYQIITTALKIAGYLLVIYSFVMLIAGVLEISGLESNIITTVLGGESAKQARDAASDTVTLFGFKAILIRNVLLTLFLGLLLASPSLQQFMMGIFLKIVSLIDSLLKTNFYKTITGG